MTVPSHPAPPAWTVLRRDGVAVVVAHEAGGLPTVRHWGADLGTLSDEDLAGIDAATSRQTPPGALDGAWGLTVLPQEGDGWPGRPGVLLTRDGAPLFPRWTVRAVDRGAAVVEVAAAAEGLLLRTRIEVGAGGLVLVEHALTNDGPGTVDVAWLEATLPVPRRADHVTTFAGRWTREKVPQTTPMPRGSTTRTSRRGRAGPRTDRAPAARVLVTRPVPWSRAGASGQPTVVSVSVAV